MAEEHSQWTRDLTKVPSGFCQTQLDVYCCAASTAERASKRSHKLLTESYTDPSSVRIAVSTSSCDDVVAKLTCYRSQRKTSKPYEVRLVLAGSGAVKASACQCAAGRSGVCSHSRAALKLLLLLKESNYSEPPPELACTELPQQWRRPRSSPLAPLPLQFVDWRAVRPGGLCKPLTSKFYDARKHIPSFADMACRIKSLGAELSSVSPSAFSRQLESGDLIESQCKIGPTAKNSPLEYLKPLVPHGFEVFLSPELQCTSSAATPPSRPILFQSCQPWDPTCVPCTHQQASILEGLQISSAQAIALEKNSRQQADSELWKEARLHRVTASSFGVVVKRPVWTEKGLRNLIVQKDLSRVRAIQYGITNEPAAVQRYIYVLKTKGHDIEAFRSGLLIDPSCPWLGASPDRLIFDPCEFPPHGILEAKCLYSMKGKSANEMGETHCMKKDDAGVFRLDRSHDYYFQVLGQMALSGLSWADFVVFSERFLIVERIRFSESDWATAKLKLDHFFFSVLLPYLASTSL